MKDKFEIFVQDKVLSSSEPSSGKAIAWNAVESKLHKHKRGRFAVHMGIAASFLLLISLGLVLLFQPQDNNSDYYSNSLQEINETSFYYSNQIEVIYAQIANFENIDIEYFELFFDEMEALDKEYEMYMEDAKEFGFQEDIIRAMVNIQQHKLRVLNSLLNEIKKVKDYENRKVSI